MMSQSNGGRDKNGRWAKGTSGNSDGRPPFKPILTKDMADAYTFGEDRMEVLLGGEVRFVSRRELNFLRLYEAASKGNVRAQIYLDKRFEEGFLAHAGLRMELAKFSWEYEQRAEDGTLNEIPMSRYHLMMMGAKMLEETPEAEAYPVLPKRFRKKNRK